MIRRDSCVSVGGLTETEIRGMNWECVYRLQLLPFLQLLKDLQTRKALLQRNSPLCSGTSHREPAELQPVQHFIEDIPQPVSERKKLECFSEKLPNWRVFREATGNRIV